MATVQDISEQVLSTSSHVTEWTLTNGEDWDIKSFTTDCNPNQDTHARLIWDYEGVGEKIIAIGYGSSHKDIFSGSITGDGTKKLALILQNDSNGPEFLGARFVVKEG